MAGNRIIVVDDSAVVRETVQAYLAREGYEVRIADGGAELRRLLDQDGADLVVVDLQMPGEDGLSVAQFLRTTQACGIIMLTAKTDVMDRIVALEIGADDYLCKPHEPRELLARVRSVLRRLEPRPAPATAGPRFRTWDLDPERRALVGNDGAVVKLTAAECKLLEVLSEKPGRVLTRESLLSIIFDRPWDYFDRSIDVLVTRLRRKLEQVAPGSDHVRSVRGTGYVFSGTATADPVSPASA